MGSRKVVLAAVLCLIADCAIADWTADARYCSGAEASRDLRIEACTRAIASGRLSGAQLAAAFNNRGQALLRNEQDLDRAIADFGEALRLEPKFAPAYYGRGSAWFGKYDLARAKPDLDEAIRLDPGLARAYLMRGLMWFEMREDDRSIADLGAAIRIEPQLAAAYASRGDAWARKGDTGRAIADFGEAIRLNPRGASTYNSFAWLLATSPALRTRDGNRAVAMAQRACELSEWKEANHVDTLAAAHADAGNFAAAVRWQEKALAYPGVSKEGLEDGMNRLLLYRAGKPYREGP